MCKPIVLEADELQELLRDSAALGMDLLAALEEREPEPHELAPDEESRCKYLSKKCLHKRAVKAKGDLHRLCTFHRAKAIVNQRRLERKKRKQPATEKEVCVEVVKAVAPPTKRRRSTKAIQNKRRRTGATTVMVSAIEINEIPDRDGDKAFDGGTLSPRDIQDLEPFRTPATLFPEDLEALQGLVDVKPLAWNVFF